MLSRTAYIFAHPGHEFRLLHTITTSPSILYIFTKGSRSTTSSERIEASKLLASKIGAIQGEVFGPEIDRTFYQAILNGDVAFFDNLVEQLVSSFIRHDVTRVVVDSWQNHNPVHDLTHLCGRLAAYRFETQTGHALQIFDYPVVTAGLTDMPCGPLVSSNTLDAAQTEAKLAAIAAYPDIAGDANLLIALDGEDVVKLETIHNLLPLDQLIPSSAPFYELYGHSVVSKGAYSEVITWSHVQAIMKGLLAISSYPIEIAA